MTADPTLGKRKIQSHRKSRRGCRNCKLRKVKCDERWPKCDKCDKYGILCNYDLRHDDLQLCSTGASAIDISILDFSPNPTWSGSSKSDASASSCTEEAPQYRPTAQDLDTLGRFFTRTIYTLASSNYMHIYHDIYSKLVKSVRSINISATWRKRAADLFQNPFLFHIVLAVTHLHDTYIQQSSSASNFEAIARHWSLGATLLNEAISQPICRLSSSTRDAMWGCAGLLGCLAFSIVDADSVEEAWPLKPPDSNDLRWLGFCEGKSAIFKISDPLRDDSMFLPVRDQMAYFMSFKPDLPLSELRKALPDKLIELCSLDLHPRSITTPAAVSKSPYLAPMSMLAQLMPQECNQDNHPLFLGFFRTLQPRFKDLLIKKDPGALLLLLFWYSKVLAFDAWWLQKRAILEYRAISRYLIKAHSDDERVTKLVELVQRSCGIELNS
ncbi:hypothetical protein LTR20_002086 [Exophiala xenobiotica]|nr:hypothetical protein LTR92_007785 [Exophiala xenobiotica]KAK5205468.1 hypothetical protein LTR41_008922 [Exophiala xenobiotica]KAK5314760.1 hypothetical protein LTR93_010143 [Exophiala xenobiotica]KAK5377625.1 hypothetical protein LTS13_004495 [Exophiala xenobiotica]KAK5400368.1 hypothetical protein LTR79_002469 [Exophiala xenobiotica]